MQWHTIHSPVAQEARLAVSQTANKPLICSVLSGGDMEET